MNTKIVLALFMAATSVLAACTTPETPSEAPQAQTPAPPPIEPAGDLKEIQQQRSDDYVVALLNETGDLKQGPNNLTLEFRRAGDNQLTDVGNVQVESMMEMQGMGPMMAKTNVTPSGTPGRYNITAELSMAGNWKTTVTFAENQKVQFDLGAQ